MDYLDGLKKTVAHVKETHPSLRLRITAHGYNAKRFKSIIELGLYTAHAKPSYWLGWNDEESSRDVVFVNRGGVPYPDEDSEAASREDDDGSDDDSDVDFVLYW